MIMKASDLYPGLSISFLRRFASGYKTWGLPFKGNASDNDGQRNSLI